MHNARRARDDHRGVHGTGGIIHRTATNSLLDRFDFDFASRAITQEYFIAYSYCQNGKGLYHLRGAIRTASDHNP